MKRFICVILCAIMSMSLVLSVSADGSIVPTIYDKEAEKENGVGRLSDEEVIKSATEWLSENASECIPEIYLKEIVVKDTLSNTATVTFGRKLNEIPFAHYHEISVKVNRMTGEVFSVTPYWYKLKSASDPKKMLSEEKLQKILFEKTGFKLMYVLVRDTNRAIPVYIADNSIYSSIDAVTGEEFEYYYAFGSAGGGSANEYTTEERNTNKNTQESSDHFVTPEEIPEIVKGFTDTVAADGEMEGNYPWQYENESYIVSLNNGTRLEIAAYGGKLISLRGTHRIPPKNERKSQNELKKICDVFLENNIGDAFDELSVLSENDEGEFEYGIVKNGIECRGNRIYLKINADSGKICYYENDFTEDIEYAPADNLISIEEAWKIMLESCGTELVYNLSRLEEPAEARLVYSLGTSKNVFAVDAKTGKLLSRRMYEIEEKPKKEPQELVIPSDIKGHWAEEKIVKLLELGVISAEDGLFRPDDSIEAKEAAAFLGVSLPAFGGSHYASTAKSRDSAVDYIMDIMWNNHVPESEAGKIEFSDAEEIAYYCYDSVALAKSLGIISGYGDGTFRPRELITRAEFATIIYNILVK